MRLPVLAALLLAACGNDRPTRPLPRHVLLIVIDTLRADHLSAYGHERETSPTLDALAARGVRFEQAVSQSSWTAPSMISLMTGRYVAEDRLEIPPSIGTLPEAFARAGWDTAAFIANELLSEENGFERGFGQVQRKPAYSANDPIVRWLEGQAGRRTLTYVHLTEPHDPYVPPPGTRRWLLDLPELPAQRRAYLQQVAAAEGVAVTDEALLQMRKDIAGYDDDILFCDARIQSFLDALQRSGQLDETLVVVTSDHGEGLWTRPDYMNGTRREAERAGRPKTLLNTLKRTHGNQVYRELVVVPLILAGPGIEPGVVQQTVENVDLAPTLLELCNIPDPGGLAGISLLRAIEDPADWSRRKPGGFSSTRFVSTLIDQEGWQLVLPSPLGECQEGLSVELYDLSSDPQCRVDLAARHPERVRQLSALVRERLADGIAGAIGDVSADNLARLQALGYVDAGMLDLVRDEFEALPTGQLLDQFKEDTSCLLRLEAARALVGRPLEASERERLAGLVAAETSDAVRRALEPLLGP